MYIIKYYIYLLKKKKKKKDQEITYMYKKIIIY